MTNEELQLITTEDIAIKRSSRHSLPTARDILAVLFRQRWALLVASIVATTAVALTGFWVPKYDAQMKILVRRQRSDAIVTSSTSAPAQMFNDQVSEEDLNSEVEFLNSEDLLRTVVITSGLSGVTGSPSDHDSQVKIEKAVRELSKDLKIETLHKSNVISVNYQASDPDKSAEVLNNLSKAFTEKHLAVHRPSGESKFFDQQTERYQQGLERAQARLTDFSKKTGIVSADVERDSALKQAEEFAAEARQAQATLLETEQRVNALQSELKPMQPRMTTVVRTSDNPLLLQQLKSTLLDLKIKRTGLLAKYESNYRPVQEVDQQIVDTTNAISAEESKPIREESSDRDPNYQWVQDELTKAQTELSGLEVRAVSAAAIARQYHEASQHLDQKGLDQQDLVRDANMQEENYLLYVHKREEARISEALDQRGILNVAMAEQPVVPALPSRSPMTIAFMTLLLVGTFSLSTAFVVDAMDPSFRTPDEVITYLGIPVLAALPKGRE